MKIQHDPNLLLLSGGNAAFCIVIAWFIIFITDALVSRFSCWDFQCYNVCFVGSWHVFALLAFLCRIFNVIILAAGSVLCPEGFWSAVRRSVLVWPFCFSSFFYFLQDSARGRLKEIPHNEKLLSLKFEVKQVSLYWKNNSPIGFCWLIPVYDLIGALICLI